MNTQEINESDEVMLHASNLSFHWPRALVPAVELADLSLRKQSSLFVQGPSGSGKSTLLALLAGVLVPTRGEIVFLDRSFSKMSGSERDRFRSDHMGYIFQQFNLVPYLSVLENVTLPLRFSARRQRKVEQPNEEAKRLLAHLGMASQDVIHRRVTELSVGQQQRVAAARALIGGPELVIADEPTSALDAYNRESFIELLFQECQRAKSALVFVSHDRGLSSHFDRSLELECVAS